METPTATLRKPADLLGPGDPIGPYRVVSRLGSGGMGVVYLAEQKTPIWRQVAVKVIAQDTEGVAWCLLACVRPQNSSEEGRTTLRDLFGPRFRPNRRPSNQFG